MDRIVLITGAAHGLGRALADEFLSREWQVIATDIDETSLAVRKGEKQAWTLKMDVTSEDSVRSVFEHISKEKLMLDMIINNAGIDNYFPLSEAPVSLFREIFEVNVFGCYRVNQVFLPLMRKPGGRIIHISSESLDLTVPFMPYPVSKKTLEGYCKSLRQELRILGVDVILIRSGAIRTRLLENVSRIHYPVSDSSLNKAFNTFMAIAPKEIKKVLEPEKVARFIYQKSQVTNPRMVYRINNNYKLKLLALLPFPLVEKIVSFRLSR